MDIVVYQSLAEIDASQWNALLSDNNPFLRHEFLNGLELTECVSHEHGWQASHIAIYSDESHASLLAAMPCYIKHHSYGEYIFDWSWADAYQRHGLQYYPKLSNAVPFTPATGERLLISPNHLHIKAELSAALLDKATGIAKQQKLSSFHSLFLSHDQASNFESNGCSIRHSSQFHWLNKAYKNFDDFLSGMSSKKRKNIKRERRRVLETGIQYRWLSGEELESNAVDLMYQFYSRTIRYYGAQSYLNLAFFEHLAKHFNKQTMFLFADYGDKTIAGGLYFKSDSTLYGRYWGALDNFHSVHFETCYYQAIQWCIDNKYQRFEAGAQGEHKLARGLEPTTTYSAHWIVHSEFRQAIDDFLNSEQQHIENYQANMQQHSPFKSDL